MGYSIMRKVRMRSLKLLLMILMGSLRVMRGKEKKKHHLTKIEYNELVLSFLLLKRRD
jgi:hypothetical protein